MTVKHSGFLSFFIKYKTSQICFSCYGNAMPVLFQERLSGTISGQIKCQMQIVVDLKQYRLIIIETIQAYIYIPTSRGYTIQLLPR